MAPSAIPSSSASARRHDGTDIEVRPPRLDWRLVRHGVLGQQLLIVALAASDRLAVGMYGLFCLATLAFGLPSLVVNVRAARHPYLNSALCALLGLLLSPIAWIVGLHLFQADMFASSDVAGAAQGAALSGMMVATAGTIGGTGLWLIGPTVLRALAALLRWVQRSIGRCDDAK